MNTPYSQKTDLSERYTIVTGTFLMLIALGLVIASFGAFFKPLSGEFGWSRGDTSGAFSTAMLLSGLMAIVTGRMADRLSPRLIIIGLGILMGCACLLLSQMQALWQLYFYFGILIGSGMSIIIPTTSLITRAYKKRRGLMTGITQAGGSIGAVIAAPFVIILIDKFNWRISYIILGSVVLIIVAVSAIFLRDPVKKTISSQDETSSKSIKIPKAQGSILLKAVRSHPFWLLGLILFSSGFTQSVLSVHIIPHTTDIGIAPIVAAAVLSVFQGACIVGNFGFGRSNDIIGGRLSIVACMIALISALLLLLIAQNIWLFYLVMILAGIGVGGAVTLRSTIVAELFGLQSHGAITGAILSISTIGSAVGPLIAGYVFDISNQYQPAFLITLGVCIMGLVMALALNKVKVKSESQLYN